MPKECCCKNWIQLLDYIENTPDLQSGFSGRNAVEKLLDGLIENSDFMIQDPQDAELAYPVKEGALEGSKVLA